LFNPAHSAGCPSPGTIFRRTRPWRVFCFLGRGLSLRAKAAALFNPAQIPTIISLMLFGTAGLASG
jgi:hypothetical protein